jgi:hypothetical protein
VLYDGSFVFEAGTIDSVMSNLEVINPEGGVGVPFSVSSGSQRNKLIGVDVINLPIGNNGIQIGGYNNNEGSNVVDGCTILGEGTPVSGSGINIGAGNYNTVSNCTFIDLWDGVSITSGSLGTSLGNNNGQSIANLLYAKDAGSTITGPYIAQSGSGLLTGTSCPAGLVTSICLGDGVGLFYNPIGSLDLGIGASPAAGARLDVQGGALRVGYGPVGTIGDIGFGRSGGSAYAYFGSASQYIGWTGTNFAITG